MSGRRLLSAKAKYGFNGKLKDNEDYGEGNAYDFGMRIYDPRLGKFMSIDKLTGKMPNLSAYAFSVNNPILVVDPDGEYPWPIHVRSFIGAKTVGGGLFRGDGRGPSISTAKDVTSRVKTSFIVDPAKSSISTPDAQSDMTVFYGAGIPGIGYIPPIAKRPSPTASITNEKFSNNSASFDFSHSAKDPVTPSFATPALDVHASLTIAENLDNGTLKVSGSFTGDRFPSTEAFIVDQSGKNKVFLNAKMEEGGVKDLFNDNKEKLFKVNMEIQFDKKGNFTGVKEGDKTYSVDDWNKKIIDDATGAKKK